MTLRVVLIGPECTGKTRLTEDLGAHYAVPFSAEYARAYVAGRRAPLSFADVDPIARGQRAGEDEAIARALALGAPLVLLDTDLLSTMVYSRHYYGDCPEWVAPLARRRRAELYLLHHVDVDWQPDGLQRAEPERRAELFEGFRAALEAIGARVAHVHGDWGARRRRAVAAIDGLIAAR